MNDHDYNKLVGEAEAYYLKNNTTIGMHEAIHGVVKTCMEHLSNRLIYNRIQERLDRATWAVVSAMGAPTGLVHPDQIRAIRNALADELLDEQYF